MPSSRPAQKAWKKDSTEEEEVNAKRRKSGDVAEKCRLCGKTPKERRGSSETGTNPVTRLPQSGKESSGH